MNEDPAVDPERVWEAGYDGHAAAQARRLAALPLWVKIDWLEEAQELIERIRAAREAAEGSEEG